MRKMASAEWKVVPLGDQAISITFGDGIDPETNERVIRFCRAVMDDPFPGLIEAVPAYHTATVFYDGMEARRSLLPPFKGGGKGMMELISEHCRRVWMKAADSDRNQSVKPRLVRIPVVYGGKRGPDLEEVAEACRIGVEDVIRLHASVEYRVYLTGFLPGFPYMGRLPKELSLDRKPTPRLNVPPGSVAIAGDQTGIYPIASPGGWRVIGQTPMVLFDPRRHPPGRLRAGDRVRFVPIPEKEWERYAKEGSREWD